MSSSLKQLEQFSLISHGAFCQKDCSNGSAPLNKMAAMPIYDRTLKNLLLQNEESSEAESWFLVAMATLDFKKREFLNNKSFKTTEAVSLIWYKYCLGKSNSK